MTEDAHTEAERIVQRVAGDRVKFGPVAALFTDKHDAERVLNIDRDRLVAALAKAIEVVEGCLCDMDPPCDELTANGVRERCEICSLHDALSALRQTDGEDI